MPGWISAVAWRLQPDHTPNQLIATGGTGVWNTTVPASGFTSSTKLTLADMSVGIENLVANAIIVPPGGHPVLASWDRSFIYINSLDAYPSSYGPTMSNTLSEGWSVDYASSNPKLCCRDFRLGERPGAVGVFDEWRSDMDAIREHYAG